VRIALEAGLWPVIVVAGSDVEQISAEVSTTGAYVIHNKDWKMGQSTSVKTGLKFVPQQSGAVIFQVVDQPGLTKDLIWALKELYYQTRGKIIQPQAAGSRTNPVLFDRSTFIDLMEISGDQGGRSIFHKYSISYLPWHDPGILLDLDNPEDIDKLHHLESANHE
jgi:molybdenum cofactor cytidylyltransferase